MRIGKVSTVAALAVVLLSIPNAEAAGTITHALGARSAARGGTNVAFTDNALLMMDNPGALHRLLKCDCRDSFVEFGATLLFCDTDYSDPQNPLAEGDGDPLGMGHFVVGHRIADDVTIAFGAFAPAGFGSEYQLQGPPGPLAGPQNYKAFGLVTRLLSGASVEVTDQLSLGGTLGAAIGHVELEGPYILNSAPLTNTPTLLDLQATGATLSWSLGAHYQLNRRTAFGIRYQSENDFQNDGITRVFIPGMGRSDYDGRVSVTWPEAVALGLTHRLSREWLVAFDVEWENWSDAYDAIRLNLSNPSNPLFGIVAPTVAETFPLQWRDSTAFKVGCERTIDDHRTLRFGYRYHRNPIPAATATTYLQTTLEHHFSVGYGHVCGGWEWDIAYQFALSSEMNVGASALAGGDFSNSTLDTDTHWIFFSGLHRF